MSFNNSKTVHLGSLVSINGGKRLPMNHNLTTEKTTHPYIRIRDLTNKRKLQMNDEIQFVSEDTFKHISKYIVKTDDIVISIVGTVGLVSIIGKSLNNANLTENCVKLSNFKYVDSYFLYYYLSSDYGKVEIDKGTVGAVQPKLPIKNIEKIAVSLPSLSVQKSIANILSSLDEKIELNNKINKNLEEIAQTLYKRWFVDFEFPNENGEPYKSSGGEMVDSELGMIPKGWEVRDVNKLFEFKGGAQPPKEEHIYEHQKGYIRFIQNRDYRDGSNHLTYIKESSKNKLANKYDIMMDKYGEVGKIRYGLEGAYNVALAKIDPYDTLDREFLRGYFSQDNILQYLSNSSIASTRGSLNATTFTGLKVAYPNKHLKLIFKEIQKNTIDMILEKKSENVKLAKIRDELLPKLMSGEIEVPVEE